VTTTRRIPVLVLLLVAVAGCDLLGVGDPPEADAALPYPDGCAAYDLSAKRCERIVAWAATQQDVDLRDAASIELLGDPGCGDLPAGAPPGGQVLCTRTNQFIVRVRFQLADGRSAEQSLFCGVGGQFSPLCTENPEVPISSPTMSGYRDVPAGSTPVPTAAPDALEAARPLRLEAWDAPLDRVGRYEVEVGEAILPNGLLSEASFRLAPEHLGDLQVTEDGITLEVRPMDPGLPPLWNLYETGWQEGTTTVRAVFVFEIVEFTPGSVLELRDIVVE
jgi:hypothetical protein